jgi:hypothetical protein
MSDDSRTDFFASGGDTTAAANQDARTAFFASGGQSDSSVPVTYDAAEFKRRVGRDPEPAELANFKAFKGVGFAGDPTQGRFTAGQAAVGGAEAALSAATSIPASIAAAPAYIAGLTGIGGMDSLSAARATRDALTYQPRTEAGQAALQTVGQIQPGEIVPRLLDVAGKPNAAQTVREVEERATDLAPLIPEIRSGFGGTRAVGRRIFSPIQDPEAPEINPLANSPQSMGAAQAVDPRLATASAPMQQAVRQAAQQTGGAVNPTALENHLEADQHGVQLTEGQATRNPATFSNEQNSTHPDIVRRINEQNEQLTDALDAVRREASPGAVSNDPIENGQTVVDKLKAYDEPVKADIDAKYEAARAASANGDLRMDGSSFVSDANAALKPQSKFRFLPANVRGILDDVANADGRMTLDDYQAYDTQLGNEVAKAKATGDGNAAFAIGKVKEALNNTQPISEETAQAKSLFDVARSAAKARFDELDADPAYRAAVDDASLNGVRQGEPSALADKFLDKYALQAPRANVDRLMTKLDSDGQQAVTAHTLSTVRKSAVTPNGTVSPNGFNTAMAKYGPKLDSLVTPETRESLESLGRVITNVKVPPPGHFVNYSKSGVIRNAATGMATELGGAALNAKTFGLGVPVIKGIAEGNFAKRVLAPGAGLTSLSTPP